VRRSQCAKAAGFLRSVGIVRPAQGFAGIVIAAQDSACFPGAGLPDDAAFASPISVRVFLVVDAKTTGKDYSMAICRQPELACMQFFHPMQTGFLT
jgi:hypothetical protein